MRNTKLHYGWIVLLGIILIRGFAGGGLNTTSGLFLLPVSNDIGVGIGTLSIYLSITSIVLVFWFPFAGRLINKYDIRFVALCAVILQAGAFSLLGLMNNVSGWYILAVPYAMGSGILANLLGPILINRWFKKNTGLILGVQMAFVGLFGAVLQPLASSLIEGAGWRNTYFILGGITFIVVILSIIFIIRDRPENKNLKPYGYEEINNGNNNKTVKSVEIPEKKALSSASFFLLLFFMISLTGVGVFTQHIPTYGSAIGYSVKQTGSALSFTSLGTAIGSIAIGIICDRLGSLKTCYGLIIVGIAAVIGFLISSGGIYVFFISAFLHGLVSAGIMVLSPILTIEFYGQQDYEKIYAKVSMGAPLASIILVPAYGFIYDITGGYFFVLIGMIVLLLAAMFCIGYGWKMRCTSEGCPTFRKKA